MPVDRSARSGRSRWAVLQALAARWITDLHRTAQGGTSLLRTRVVTLRVALFAVIGARLIKPGRFETPSRAASAEDYCENDERSCHLTPPPRRNIWQQVYRRQVEFGYRSLFVTIWRSACLTAWRAKIFPSRSGSQLQVTALSGMAQAPPSSRSSSVRSAWRARWSRSFAAGTVELTWRAVSSVSNSSTTRRYRTAR
jgi:hypothetical protein